MSPSNQKGDSLQSIKSNYTEIKYVMPGPGLFLKYFSDWDCYLKIQYVSSAMTLYKLQYPACP